MAVDFDSLTAPLTADQLKVKYLDFLAAFGIRTTSWLVGSVVYALVCTAAVIVAAVWAEFQALGKMFFLDYSVGDYLTITASLNYGTDRIPAKFATGFVTLTNAGGGEYSLNVGDLIVVNSTTNKTYRNTTAFTLHASETLTVSILATELGAASNSAAGQIDTLEVTLLGVTCANATAVVGNDEESDSALRIRARERSSTLSPNGPSGAYDYFAKCALLPDGSPVSVTRTKINTSSSTATVTVICAGPAGPLSSLETLAVQENILLHCVPLGVNYNYLDAARLTAPIFSTVTVPANCTLSNSEIQAAVSAALVSWAPSVPIGGYLLSSVEGASGYVFQEQIQRVILDSVPDIYHCQISNPSSDITLTDTTVLLLGSVSTTVNRV